MPNKKRVLFVVDAKDWHDWADKIGAVVIDLGKNRQIQRRPVDHEKVNNPDSADEQQPQYWWEK